MRTEPRGQHAGGGAARSDPAARLLEAVVDAVPPVKGPRGRRADVLLGFVQLACALICLKQLNQPKA